MISLTDITLDKWIAYTGELQPLIDKLEQINQLPYGLRKDVYLSKNYVDRAFATYNYFMGDNPNITVSEAENFYQALTEQLADEYKPFTYEREITFGQFIDAKQIVSGGSDKSKWEILKYLIVIFGVDKYVPEMIEETSSYFAEAGRRTMNRVVSFSKWWEDFNNEILSTYTLFQDSGEDEGANMREHMNRWGWINFLKSIAKTKVFDISGSGLNSIDCARAASLSDVLHWASEEKDYSIALMRDMRKNN